MFRAISFDVSEPALGSFNMSVLNCTPVQAVVVEVCQKWNIPQNRVSLLFEGSIINPSSLLKDVGVESHDTIMVVIEAPEPTDDLTGDGVVVGKNRGQKNIWTRRQPNMDAESLAMLTPEERKERRANQIKENYTESNALRSKIAGLKRKPKLSEDELKAHKKANAAAMYQRKKNGLPRKYANVKGMTAEEKKKHKQQLNKARSKRTTELVRAGLKAHAAAAEAKVRSAMGRDASPPRVGVHGEVRPSHRIFTGPLAQVLFTISVFSILFPRVPQFMGDPRNGLNWRRVPDTPLDVRGALPDGTPAQLRMHDTHVLLRLEVNDRYLMGHWGAGLGIQLHRALALAFIPGHSHARNYADHCNQDKLDNRLDNLRWSTAEQNANNARAYRGEQEPLYLLQLPAGALQIHSLFGNPMTDLFYARLPADGGYYFFIDNGYSYRRVLANILPNGLMTMWIHSHPYDL